MGRWNCLKYVYINMHSMYGHIWPTCKYISEEQSCQVDFLSIMVATYQWDWLVGMLEIFYLNKQHPFAPYNWLAHISCCLLRSITWDESDKATAPLQCGISCTSLSQREWWDVSVSKSISRNSGLSAVTHAQTATEMWLRYGREVSLIEWPPHILGEKNEVSEQKVVIDWNTLNDVECPPDRNQFCPFL